MEQQSLDIRRSSAATSVPPSARTTMEVGKLIDISRCIGCKACQSACMEWNDLRNPVGDFDGFYTNPRDLDDQTWCLMRFNEAEINGSLQWLILKDGCMHCTDPGCMHACPAPGAIVQYSNGIVDFQEANCIGCGYCISGCPFDIPRLRKDDAKVYKCTLCSDRIAVGLEPACIKSCPTQALSFGSREDMLALAHHRLEDLNDRGFAKAAVYDPAGVGGTHVFYVLPHGDRPEAYGLPAQPTVSPVVELWRSTFARGFGVFTMFAVLGAGILHYMRHGPLEVPDDDTTKDKEEPPSWPTNPAV
jgi:formate dehydrogenase iron-sulfur subunit